MCVQGIHEYDGSLTGKIYDYCYCCYLYCFREWTGPMCIISKGGFSCKTEMLCWFSLSFIYGFLSWFRFNWKMLCIVVTIFMIRLRYEYFYSWIVDWNIILESWFHLLRDYRYCAHLLLRLIETDCLHLIIVEITQVRVMMDDIWYEGSCMSSEIKYVRYMKNIKGINWLIAMDLI